MRNPQTPLKLGALHFIDDENIYISLAKKKETFTFNIQFSK